MEINAMDLDELLTDMYMEGVDRLDEFDNIATLPTSNFGGLVIIVNSTGESVFIQNIWDSGFKDIEECEIKYDEKCEWAEGEVCAYFEYNGNKYYLNEFMVRR